MYNKYIHYHFLNYFSDFDFKRKFKNLLPPRKDIASTKGYQTAFDWFSLLTNIRFPS